MTVNADANRRLAPANAQLVEPEKRPGHRRTRQVATHARVAALHGPPHALAHPVVGRLCAGAQVLHGAVSLAEKVRTATVRP